MARRRRNYTREFKAEAVKLVTEQGYSVAEAARSLGIHETLLRSWKQALQDKGDQAFPGLRPGHGGTGRVGRRGRRASPQRPAGGCRRQGPRRWLPERLDPRCSFRPQDPPRAGGAGRRGCGPLASGVHFRSRAGEGSRASRRGVRMEVKAATPHTKGEPW